MADRSAHHDSIYDVLSNLQGILLPRQEVQLQERDCPGVPRVPLEGHVGIYAHIGTDSRGALIPGPNLIHLT